MAGQYAAEYARSANRAMECDPEHAIVHATLAQAAATMHLAEVQGAAVQFDAIMSESPLSGVSRQTWARAAEHVKDMVGLNEEES